MQDWDDLKFFLAVARHGSLTAAAASLGVNQSTVSRRINQFERSMEVRLFERLSNGYVLTTEGEELLRRVEHIEEEIHGIQRHVMGRNVQLSGVIRITSPVAFCHHELMPRLADFSRQHPDIQLELDLSDSVYNLSRREADIAIRISREPVPENLIARQLGYIHYGVYGSNKYLAAYLRRKTASPLKWIGEANPEPRPNWLPRELNPLQLVMRSNNVLATHDAIRQGLGVGRLPGFIGERDKRLRKLETAQRIPPAAIWLLMHPDMRPVRRVRVLVAFLQEQLRQALPQQP